MSKCHTQVIAKDSCSKWVVLKMRDYLGCNFEWPIPVSQPILVPQQHTLHALLWLACMHCTSLMALFPGHALALTATKRAYASSAAQEFVEGPFSQSNLDPGASMIIPVPGPTGGVVVVGESVIMYVRKKRSGDDQAVKSIRVKATIVKVRLADSIACCGLSAGMHVTGVK